MRLLLRFLCSVLPLLLASAANAQPSPLLEGEPPAWASLARPLRLDVRPEGAQGLLAPVWTRDGLLAAPPVGLRGLARVAQSGIPVWDPDSKAWYATAEGCLVRVEADGSLSVLFDGVQGVDVDVRANKGLAVSREPDGTIVLWRLNGEKKVLLSGMQYFRPRFSPDGSRLLVSESRAEGGHTWLVALDGKATDLGQSIDATWHPDGGSVVFVRVVHDGHSILSSSLHQRDLATGRERTLSRALPTAALAPVVSPDGRFVALRAAQDDAVLVAPLPRNGEARGEGR